MQLDVWDITSHQFTRSLDGLRAVLLKAQEHAKQRNFDENLFLDMKMAPDMFTLAKQVQMTCDTAKFACSRLSGKTAPVFADDEKTLAQLIARVSNTMEYVQGFKREDFANWKTQTITFPWNPGKSLTGAEYLTGFAVPNFYFHDSMTYALLRQVGVNVGKGDYLSKLNWN